MSDSASGEPAAGAAAATATTAAAEKAAASPVAAPATGTPLPSISHDLHGVGTASPDVYYQQQRGSAGSVARAAIPSIQSPPPTGGEPCNVLSLERMVSPGPGVTVTGAFSAGTAVRTGAPLEAPMAMPRPGSAVPQVLYLADGASGRQSPALAVDRRTGALTPNSAASPAYALVPTAAGGSPMLMGHAVNAPVMDGLLGLPGQYAAGAGQLRAASASPGTALFASLHSQIDPMGHSGEFAVTAPPAGHMFALPLQAAGASPGVALPVQRPSSAQQEAALMGLAPAAAQGLSTLLANARARLHQGAGAADAKLGAAAEQGDMLHAPVAFDRIASPGAGLGHPFQDDLSGSYYGTRSPAAPYALVCDPRTTAGAAAGYEYPAADAAGHHAFYAAHGAYAMNGAGPTPRLLAAAAAAAAAAGPADGLAGSPPSSESTGGRRKPHRDRGRPAVKVETAAEEETVVSSGGASGKIFRCTWHGCNKGYKRREHLNRHMRSHTGERPYACRVPNCKKAFSRSDNLINHYRVHQLREEVDPNLTVKELSHLVSSTAAGALMPAGAKAGDSGTPQAGGKRGTAATARKQQPLMEIPAQPVFHTPAASPGPYGGLLGPGGVHVAAAPLHSGLAYDASYMAAYQQQQQHYAAQHQQQRMGDMYYLPAHAHTGVPVAASPSSLVFARPLAAGPPAASATPEPSVVPGSAGRSASPTGADKHSDDAAQHFPTPMASPLVAHAQVLETEPPTA